MSRTAWIVVVALAFAGCAPEPAEDSGQLAVPGPAAPAPGAAASFDAGPVRSAAEYMAEARYADADLERGELLSLACIACHTFRLGEPHMLGPNLGGMFGMPAASKDGFAYSPALRDSGLVWTPRALEAWLAQPAGFVPGTSMVFAGYGADSDRRDVVAYLLGVTQNRAP